MGIDQANLGKQHPLMHTMSFQGNGDDDLINPSSNAESMEGADGSEGRSQWVSTSLKEGTANKKGKEKKQGQEPLHHHVCAANAMGAHPDDMFR